MKQARVNRCVLLADCAGSRIGKELTRSNHDAALLVIQTLFGLVSRSDKFNNPLAARTEAVDTVNVGFASG